MKLFTLSALALALSATSALAQTAPRFQPGHFFLIDVTRLAQSPGCTVGTELVLQGSPQAGVVAHLRERVLGACEIYVEPNVRSYRLQLAETSCGSLIFRGVARLADGRGATLELTDHRSRMCMDLVPAQIVAQEQIGAYRRLLQSIEVKGGIVGAPQNRPATRPATHLVQPKPVNGGVMGCMAYFTGWTYDAEARTCVERGASGCSNPFLFSTRDACLAGSRR